MEIIEFGFASIETKGGFDLPIEQNPVTGDPEPKPLG